MKNILVISFVITIGTLAKAHAYESILFLGDSHSYGRYGETLDQYFRKNASKVTSIASCGSSPSTWVNVKSNFKSTNCGYWKKDRAEGEVRVKSQKLESFESHLQKTNADLVVISLGTNILASPGNIQSELKNIEAMILQAKKQGADCVWVGPPDLRRNPFKANLEKGIEAIKTVVEKNKCRFVDSTKLTKYPSGKTDGIHYGPSDSKKWGESVQNEFEKNAYLKSIPQPNAVPAPRTNGTGVK